jgi:hypothetical protein
VLVKRNKMPSIKLDKEVLKRNQEVLGIKLGEYFSYIYDDVYYLIYVWQEFNELFGKSTKRLDVLNESTSSFFSLVQNLMMANIVLGICRLTDPIKPPRIDTTHLSLYILPKEINEPNFKKEIYTICSKIKKEAKEIRDARDNYIAHTDYQKLVDGQVMKIQYDSVEKTIDLFYQVLKAFYVKYYKSDLQKEIVTPLKGAETLLYLINDGIEYRKRKYEKIMAGNFSEDDKSP